MGLRLLDKVYNAEDGKPSKFWLCFAKKKFMDKSLSAPGMWEVITNYHSSVFHLMSVHIKGWSNKI